MRLYSGPERAMYASVFPSPDSAGAVPATTDTLRDGRSTIANVVGWRAVPLRAVP